MLLPIDTADIIIDRRLGQQHWPKVWTGIASPDDERKRSLPMMWISSLPWWWRISPASTTTRLGKRIVSKPVAASKGSGNATLETNEILRASPSASSEPSQTHDALGENDRPEKTWTALTTDEARKFVELYEKGETIREIRVSMPNRSYNALTTMAWRYNRGDLANLLNGKEGSDHSP